MERRVYIDVETAPPFGTFPNPAKVKAPRHYKDPKKIEAYQEEHAYPEWASQALHPAKAQVIIIGVAVDEQPVWQGVSMNEGDLMQQVEAYLDEVAPTPDAGTHPVPVYYAFNMEFDFSMLAARAVKYGRQRLARRFKISNKYNDSTHKDPFLALGREGSLTDWARFFGIERTSSVTGDQVYELIRQGKGALAQQKNIDDVLVLRELVTKLREGGLL